MDERGAWMRKRIRLEDGSAGWEGPEWVPEAEVPRRMQQKWRACAAPGEEELGAGDGSEGRSPGD